MNNNFLILGMIISAVIIAALWLAFLGFIAIQIVEL